MALDQEMNGEVYAAISTALHLYMEDSVHDKESFVITIRRKESGWNSKEQYFRQFFPFFWSRQAWQLCLRKLFRAG